MTDNLFDRLAELFQAPGPVNWRLAREIAESMAGPEEPVDPWSHEQYRDLAATAQRLVGACCPFDPLAAVHDVQVPDRRTWASSTVETLAYIAEPVAERLATLAGPATGLPPMAAPLLGIQAGALIGTASHRVLGRFDLGLPGAVSGTAIIVASNLTGMASEHGFDEQGLRLWACLREVAYHGALGVPWMTGHVMALGRSHADELEIDTDAASDGLRLLSDPDAIRELVEERGEIPNFGSPLQAGPSLGNIAALSALLDGYADVVVRRAAAELLPELDAMTAAYDVRRERAADGERMMQRALGIDLEPDLPARGREFCTQVARRWGDETLDRIWESLEMLPTLEELDDATGWAARTLL